MTTISHLSLISIVFTLFFSSNSTLLTHVNTANNPKRVVLKLVHRFSTTSPFYNSNNTFFDYLKKNLKHFSNPQTYIQAPLGLTDSNYNIFLVKFSIGQPPVQQYAYMDTGSSLVWVHCNLTKRLQKYDPGKSSTYHTIPCFSSVCVRRLGMSCDDYRRCKYSKSYLSNQSSSGLVAFEQFTFGSEDEGIASINNVIFGCSLYYEGKIFMPAHTNGVFGLGAEFSSIIDTLATKKFSYCIGSVDKPYYPFNQLTLGEGVDTEGDRIPLHISGGHYYLSVNGISLGGKMLDIDSSILTFKEGQADTGIIIDTGSFFTLLVKPAYDIVYKEVKKILDPFFPRFISQVYQLCYRGNISGDLTGFPVFRFHFPGGAELALDTQSLFRQRVEVFCMTIEPSKAGLSIIGLISQQNYNVAYDLEEQMLSLQRIDCELINE